MRPPKTINVLDKHSGFTAITRAPTYIKTVIDPVCGEREATSADYTPTLKHTFARWKKVYRESDTIWRPGSLLKNPIGVLDGFDENSFYQTNDNVTKAFYKVKGYPYRVVCWFDNDSGERIA